MTETWSRHPYAEGLRVDTLAYSRAFFDDDVALICNPPGTEADIAVAGSLHLVPNSCWYAYALLGEARREPSTSDSLERAERVLRTVLGLQLLAPGEQWHGTFRRFLEWPATPPGDAVEWWDFDPNWRQFVSCAFIMILDEFADMLSADLVESMEGAVAVAVDSEPPGRIPEGYTNPRLMQLAASAWLSHRYADEDRARAVVAELSRVEADFEARHGHFAEFNSPTYDGINLFALSMLCDLVDVFPQLQPAHALREALWSQIEILYVPELDNIVGPFSRAYGPDMSAYVALVSLWIRARTGRWSGPRFDLDPARAVHGHDLMLGPLIADQVTRWGVAGSAQGQEGASHLRWRVGGRSVEMFRSERYSLGVETSQTEADWVGAHQRMPMVMHTRGRGGLIESLWARTGTWQVIHADAESVTVLSRGCVALECAAVASTIDGRMLRFDGVQGEVRLPGSDAPTWTRQRDVWTCAPVDDSFELVFTLVG